MITAPVADARPGHNRGPVTPPFETDLLDDLKYRYPNVQTKFDELLRSATEVPETIQEDEQAGKVQELLRGMGDALRRWKADRTAEKGPWAKLADIAYNFFKDKEDKLSIQEKLIRARHTIYLEKKADAEEKRRAELAETLRKEAARLEQLAKDAKEDALWAEARQELAEWEETNANRRKREAQEDQLWAEARAELAAYDEGKALERKAEREKLAAMERKIDMAKLKKLNKEADALAVKDKAETITDEERDRYRQLIGSGGEIPALQARLAGDRSHLTDEERAELEGEADNLARLRAERIDNHAAAEKAKAERVKAQNAERAATKQANTLAAEVKETSREATQLAKGAEKADARAGRAKRQVENATNADLSRTRSELGTVGSLSGRWVHVVEDDAALLAYCGPLGKFFTPEDRKNAVYRYMREHQHEFTETPARTEVPGVFFENVPESRVR